MGAPAAVCGRRLRQRTVERKTGRPCQEKASPPPLPRPRRQKARRGAEAAGAGKAGGAGKAEDRRTAGQKILPPRRTKKAVRREAAGQAECTATGKAAKIHFQKAGKRSETRLQRTEAGRQQHPAPPPRRAGAQQAQSARNGTFHAAGGIK